MLDTLRKKTKVILWITVVTFLITIVLVWGGESQVGCGLADGVIGRVNGSPIMVETFNQVLQARREQMRQNRGGEMGPGDEAAVVKQTWDAIVEEKLLNEEALKRGLVATDAEVLHTARNNPPADLVQNPQFQTNGQFDLAKYQQILDNPDIDPSFFLGLEAYIRSTLPIEKLQNLVYSTAVVSDAEIRRAFRDRNEQARVTYRQYLNTSYTLPTAVTDAEAETYFKAHPDEFDLPAQASVRYVRLERKPTQADFESLRQQMADYAAIARRAAAGDSNALNLAALAETYSELPSAAQGGLDPQFHTRGSLAPSIEQVAFGLPVGGISDPIQDNLVFHVIQVDSVLDAPEGRQIRIRDLMMKVQPSDATLTALDDSIEALKTAGARSGFEKAAKDAQLTVNTPPPFAEGAWIQGLESVAGAVDWAFRSEPGAITSMASNDAHFVLELVKRSPKGRGDFKSSLELARKKATEARQRELATKDADAFRSRASGATDWKALAGTDSNSVRTVGPFTRSSGIPGVGREADALGAVYTLPIGQVSAPITTARGIVVLRVDERKPADEGLFAGQKNQLTQQLLNQRRTEIYQDWLKQLKATAKIQDYRDVYIRS